MSASAPAKTTAPERFGRYVLYDEIARGGMAAVHIGRLVGPVGFSRTVAIKRLHPHLCEDTSFVAMLLDEARLASRIQHPNVVAMLDVVHDESQVLLVMEYVAGESLMRLLRLERERGGRVPPAIASAILIDTLRGLHAAHEARTERGQLLELIHRDFTPHNIMVRTDGTSVVVDFGVAKAIGRLHKTEEGTIKGKLPYMAPEQVRARDLTRRVDIYAAGAVLWETLVGARAIVGETEAEVLERLLYDDIAPPSTHVTGIGPALDAVVMRALARDPSDRFPSAADMARALEEAQPPALPSRVAEWISSVAGERLGSASQRLAALEARSVEAGSPHDAHVHPLPRDEPSASGSREIVRGFAEHSEIRPHFTTASAGKEGKRRGWLAMLLVAALVPATWLGFRALVPAVRATPTVDSTASPAMATSPSLPPVASGPSVVPEPSPSPVVPEPSSAPGASASAPIRRVTAPPPHKARCAPVTVDPSGKKLFHPECMNDR